MMHAFTILSLATLQLPGTFPIDIWNISQDLGSIAVSQGAWVGTSQALKWMKMMTEDYRDKH